MFVFPMAGLSSRFAKAGYVKPKFMLDAGGFSVFWHVLIGFRRYFNSERFLFVCKNDSYITEFVISECSKLMIKNFEIVSFDHTTRGQAETVYIGISSVDISPDAPILIFNIDTIHKDFRLPPTSLLANSDGYLEVFNASGDGWSFVRTVSDTDLTVLETAEKVRISPLCSTGLYYFSQSSSFISAYLDEVSRPTWMASELFVAPLYNILIRCGMRILAVNVPSSDIILCGVPQEYEAFANTFSVSADKL